MAYATAADMLLRFDANTLGDLCSDTGDPVGSVALATDAVLAAALEDGAGQIASALMVGNQYTVESLATLAGSSLAALKRLNCVLAMAFLLLRRPGKFADEYAAQMIEETEKTLDRLRKGERVFALEEIQASGLPTIDGPTAVDYRRLNLLPDRTQHFYPSRASRLPLGRE